MNGVPALPRISLSQQLAAVELAAKPDIVRDGMRRYGSRRTPRHSEIEKQINDLTAVAQTLCWLQEHRDLILAVAAAVNDNADPFKPIDEIVTEIVSRLKGAPETRAS